MPQGVGVRAASVIPVPRPELRPLGVIPMRSSRISLFPCPLSLFCGSDFRSSRSGNRNAGGEVPGAGLRINSAKRN